MYLLFKIQCMQFAYNYFIFMRVNSYSLLAKEMKVYYITPVLKQRN